jgi:hypothetical protein
LFESIEVVNNTRETLKMVKGKAEKKIYETFQNIIEKYNGFTILKKNFENTSQ